MDDTQKSRIRLSHWIEHNNEHLKGYDEVASTLERQGLHEAADRIRKGMALVVSANREFEHALGHLPSAGEDHEVSHDPSHHGHHH
jgi:hypothetical protein